MAKYSCTQNQGDQNGQSVLKICNNVNVHQPASSVASAINARTESNNCLRSTLREHNVEDEVCEKTSQNDSAMKFIGVTNQSDEGTNSNDSSSKSLTDSVSLLSDRSALLITVARAKKEDSSSPWCDKSIEPSIEVTTLQPSSASTARKLFVLSQSTGISSVGIENIPVSESVTVLSSDSMSNATEVRTKRRSDRISNISYPEYSLTTCKSSTEFFSSKLLNNNDKCTKSSTNAPISNIVNLSSDSESPPLSVSSPKPSKVGKYLDNSPLHSLMNVKKGGDDEGKKTKRRSLKSKVTERKDDSSNVKRKRRFIHEFFSQSDTKDKTSMQNEATKTADEEIILSDEINSLEVTSIILNGNEAVMTSDSPVIAENSNDSSVLTVENEITDDVIVISDSQSQSPNISASSILPDVNAPIDECVSIQDESTKSPLLMRPDDNFNVTSETSVVQVRLPSPEKTCNLSDVLANEISPSKRSPPNVTRDPKRKSDPTIESTNGSPSSVSHSRSFRIIRLACNDDDDVSWRFSRENNSKSFSVNATGSGHINGNATPSSAVMNGRTMKMLMVKSESSHGNKMKSFKSRNSTTVEKKTKRVHQYVVKECTSPGILKNSAAKRVSSPKPSKMVNFAENLTHTKFYRVGDGLYDDYNSDEEKDDEFSVVFSSDILYPPLRNCRDTIDSLVEELSMDTVTVELFHRMGIKTVGDLASMRMVEANDSISATDYYLDKLRKILKKYNKERRPTGLRTPSFRTTSRKTVLELLDEIRKAHNANRLSATDAINEGIRNDDTVPNMCIEKFSDIHIRTDDTLTDNQQATSSVPTIPDKSSRFEINENNMVLNQTAVELTIRTNNTLTDNQEATSSVQTILDESSRFEVNKNNTVLNQTAVELTIRTDNTLTNNQEATSSVQTIPDESSRFEANENNTVLNQTAVELTIRTDNTLTDNQEATSSLQTIPDESSQFEANENNTVLNQTAVELTIRTDNMLTDNQEATSSVQTIPDESSRFEANDNDIVLNAEVVESTSLFEEDVEVEEEVTTSIHEQEHVIGIENEYDSDFVCTNDEGDIDSNTLAKLSEVSRCVPTLRNIEQTDQINVTPYSPEIITSDITLDHQRDDDENDQSQTLDLEDSNEPVRREEADPVPHIKLIFWKQASVLAVKQLAVEQHSIKRSIVTTSSTSDNKDLVDDFVKMTTDLLEAFHSSNCLNATCRRSLADVCQQVADSLAEESSS